MPAQVNRHVLLVGIFGICRNNIRREIMYYQKKIVQSFMDQNPFLNGMTVYPLSVPTWPFWLLMGKSCLEFCHPKPIKQNRNQTLSELFFLNAFIFLPVTLFHGCNHMRNIIMPCAQRQLTRKDSTSRTNAACLLPSNWVCMRTLSY